MRIKHYPPSSKDVPAGPLCRTASKDKVMIFVFAIAIMWCVHHWGMDLCVAARTDEIDAKQQGIRRTQGNI